MFTVLVLMTAKEHHVLCINAYVLVVRWLVGTGRFHSRSRKKHSVEFDEQLLSEKDVIEND